MDSQAINVRLMQEVIDALDSFRKTEADLPTRPEGIRRLLVEKLQEKGFLK